MNRLCVLPRLCRLLVLLLSLGSTVGSALAQGTSETMDYQSRVEKRIQELRQEYQDRRAGRSGTTSSASSSSLVDPLAPPPLSSYGAQWQVRSVRYTCAGGLAINTSQQISSKDFVNAVSDRKDSAANTGITAIGKPPTAKTEIDALDDLDASLRKLKPVVLKFKFKTYELLPERGVAGWHYVNRVHGVSWGLRNNKGILKNTYSGRVLAQDCRAGSPFVQDAPESADQDLSAFAKKPPGTTP